MVISDILHKQECSYTELSTTLAVMAVYKPVYEVNFLESIVCHVQ